MAIRMIATDVDGTLLNSRGEIPAENVKAIRDAQEKGIIVAIASGRFAENVYVLLEKNGLRCPVIGVNGGSTADENLKPLFEHTMDPAAVDAVRRLLEEENAQYYIFARKKIGASEGASGKHRELSDTERIRSLGFTYTSGTDESWDADSPVYKFFVGNSIPLPPLREKLRNVPGIEVTQSWFDNIELMPAGVDKALGVRELAGHYSIGMRDVMTCGDQENDIPMLRTAGLGVAMGNASEETVRAADVMTDTNDRCGFAKAVRRYALGTAE